MRCFNCGTEWSQPLSAPLRPPAYLDPDFAGPAMAEPEPVRVQPPPPPQPPPPAPPPPPLPQPPPEPEASDSGEETGEQLAADAAPEAPPPEPEAPDSGEETGEQLAADAAPEAPPPEPAEEETFTDEELEEMLGAETDLETMESLVPEDGEETQTSDVEDPEDIPEPDPIPQSLTADTSDDDDDDESPAKRPEMRLVIAGASALSLLIVLLAAAFFARGTIVSMWPSAAGLYATIGLGESLGAGLDIRDVRSVRSTEGGVDVLVVREIINNVSGGARSVPLIRVVLMDSVDEEVMTMVIPPSKSELPSGENVGFSARIEDPPGTARRLEVMFTEAEDQAPMGEEAPAAGAVEEAPATESADKPAS